VVGSSLAYYCALDLLRHSFCVRLQKKRGLSYKKERKTVLSMNGHGNPNNTVLVLYKVVNSDTDKDDTLFNAFPMPRGQRGPTLATVKQNCRALHGLSHMGPEGYHWRVCVEDKAPPGEAASGRKSYSWWDIQDENAVLPVKEASSSHLRKFFAPPREDSVGDTATKAAKGAFKSLGKALAGSGDGQGADTGPPVCVIAFKLLDLVKVHDDFTTKNHGRGGRIPQEHHTPRAAPPRAAPRTSGGYQAPQQARQTPPTQPKQQQQRQGPQQQAPRQPAPAVDLMGFGSSPALPARHAPQHSHSMASSGGGSVPGESRAERLKREYAQKNATAQRVWDAVDERWVDAASTSSGGSGSAAPPRPGAARNIGISLDPTSAVGKSAAVQQAVNARVNEMKESQAKALQEVREREEAKKKEEAEEDEVRKRLEPKIKAWSEEHGKKKQLRALLGTLHTILWPEAKWKQVTIGDMLNDAKCKKFYHKATLVVHPDKTHHLDAEKRFLAKRIFDALSQAKVEFDAGRK